MRAGKTVWTDDWTEMLAMGATKTSAAAQCGMWTRGRPSIQRFTG